MTVSFRDIANRMDPVRPPTRLRGASSSSDPDEDQGGWQQGGDVAKKLASDFGRYHSHEKGLLQVHRGETNSLREVGERHVGQDSTSHKLLVYNTALLSPGHSEIEARAMDIGRMIGRRGYDIACLSEVFGADETDTIRERVDNYGETTWQEAFGPPDDDGLSFDTSGGLYGLVGGNERRLVDSSHEEYSDSGEGMDEFANKGWLLMAVDLGPGTLDIFLTHMDSGNHYIDILSRMKQIEELSEAIDERRREYPNHVMMAVGDFNVYSSIDEYCSLLAQMWDECSLQDVWLTRGGKAGATHAFESYCTNVGPPECTCDDYNQGDYGGDRLDYIFVEKPRWRHDFHLDISRVQRRPFPRAEPCGDVDPGALADDEYDHMSDHLGLDVELIASPK